MGSRIGVPTYKGCKLLGLGSQGISLSREAGLVGTVESQRAHGPAAEGQLQSGTSPANWCHSEVQAKQAGSAHPTEAGNPDCNTKSTMCF